jgi:uncharacterized protein (DUF1778 family)
VTHVTTSPKSERLSLRLDPLAKQKIEQASSLANCSVNSFILSSVLDKAEQLISTHETVKLTDRDRDLFFAAILNPPVPNPALKEALALHQRLAESDV